MPIGRATSIKDQRKSQERSIDEVIAELARRQHGIVSRSQLLRAGYRPGAVEYRARRHRLHRVFLGAYSVSPVVSGRGRYMAAVLSAGPDAVLSHRAAAALWGIREDRGRRVEITVPRCIRSTPDVRIYRSCVPDDERATRDGIPLTTTARTLLDLAGVLDRPGLERAMERAEALRLTHQIPLSALLSRHPGRPGTADLRGAVAADRAGGATESELEDRFLAFAARVGLPPPELNVWLQLGTDWVRADCLWRAERLIVELDSRSFHATRAAFERDRRRDRRALAAGWRTIRVTWAMLEHQETELGRDLRRLMADVISHA